MLLPLEVRVVAAVVLLVEMQALRAPLPEPRA